MEIVVSVTAATAYMPGRWAPVAQAMVDHMHIKAGDKILDIGCGKGFQLYEITLLVPGVEVYGLDISFLRNRKLQGRN